MKSDEAAARHHAQNNTPSQAPMLESAVSVIGLGKLGACMAAAMASRGVRTIGVDISPAAVDGDTGACIHNMVTRPRTIGGPNIPGDTPAAANMPPMLDGADAIDRHRAVNGILECRRHR